MALSPPVKLRFIAGAAGAAGPMALVLSWAAFGGHDPSLSIAYLLIPSAALALSHAFPLFVFRKGETEALSLDEAFLVALILVLDPFDVVVVFALGSLAGQLVRRRGLLKAVFNVGQTLFAAALSVWVATALGSWGGSAGTRVAATMAGAAVFLVVNFGAVSLVVSVAQGKPFWEDARNGFRPWAMVWAGNVSAGLLVGVAAGAAMWSLALAAVPLGLLHLSFAGHLRAHRDRERMDGLLDTTMKLHRSVHIEDVEREIGETVAKLLRSGKVRVDSVPPLDGELGALLGGRGPRRWLIVSERFGAEPFDVGDKATLEAIATVATAALENADLYRLVKEEQEKLAGVVDFSSDGIFSVDENERVVLWNRAMAHITGYDTTSMSGRTLDLLRPRNAEGRQALREGWTTRRNDVPKDLKLTAKDGSERWVECSVSAGPEGGFVVVARDVTTERETEDLKTDFLAIVSHELRTPLTPIHGFLAMLESDEDRYTREQRKGFYRRMLRQTQRLRELVDELLEAVSLQGTGGVILTRSFDWPSAAAAVIEGFREQQADRRFEVFSSLESRMAYADPVRAEQVLANLIGNAVKYCPPGSTIRVEIEGEPDRLTTIVSDEGSGVALADRAKIFGRFTRLGHHLTRESGGVGLGLYICKKLVEAMDGEIWVDEAPGGGAAFKFTLPTAQAAGLEVVPGDLEKAAAMRTG